MADNNQFPEYDEEDAIAFIRKIYLPKSAPVTAMMTSTTFSMQYGIITTA